MIETSILFGLAAMFSWGIADLLAKIAVQKVGYKKTFLVGHILGLIPYLVVYFVLNKQIYPSWDLFVILVFGAFFNFMGYLTFYKGLVDKKISLLSPIVACNPIVIVFLGIVILKENLLTNHWFGIIFALTGVFLVSLTTKEFKFDKGLMTLGIGSLLSWGIGIFTLGYISKKFDWFTILMFWRVVTWAFAPIFMRVKRPFHFEKINTLMFILLVGIIDILGAVFYAFSATKGMISIVGPIAALFPAVTIVLARIFLKEKLIFNQKIGVVSILVGLVLLSI